MFFHAHVDQFLLKLCTKFLGKVTIIKGVTGTRRPHMQMSIPSSFVISIMISKYFATNYGNN